jgi:uncharacterized protein
MLSNKIWILAWISFEQSNDGGWSNGHISQVIFEPNKEGVFFFVKTNYILFLPRSVLSWNIDNYLNINEKTLSLFCVLEPKIDVLVIGVGDQQITPDFSKQMINFMRKYNINVEVLSTEQVCAYQININITLKSFFFHCPHRPVPLSISWMPKDVWWVQQWYLHYTSNTMKVIWCCHKLKRNYMKLKMLKL